MGALFGFTGPPDGPLALRLGRALTHRGRGEPRTVARAHATLGFLTLRGPSEDARIGAGVATDVSRRTSATALPSSGPLHEPAACDVALAGHLLDRRDLVARAQRADGQRADGQRADGQGRDGQP
ncbi:MAG: hypothetical protein R3F49_25475, partial [Planctomycetota bacterium]